VRHLCAGCREVERGHRRHLADTDLLRVLLDLLVLTKLEVNR